jgi:hypothetical protein
MLGVQHHINVLNMMIDSHETFPPIDLVFRSTSPHLLNFYHNHLIYLQNCVAGEFLITTMHELSSETSHLQIVDYSFSDVQSQHRL